MYLFPSVRCLWSHFEERTNEIVMRMVEAQMNQRSLWHQSRHLKDSCDSTHYTHLEATTKDVLWALLYLDSPIHTASKCTKSIWAVQCTQEVLQEEHLPFHPNIHTYCCTSCIFWCYNKHISNHHQNIDLLSSNLHLLSLMICSAGLHIPRDMCEHR